MAFEIIRKKSVIGRFLSKDPSERARIIFPKSGFIQKVNEPMAFQKIGKLRKR